MAPHEKRHAAERLQTQLAALRSRLARLPQSAQAEFRPLVDDLQLQLERPGRPRGDIRRWLDEIRAIDKCVRFEQAVPLQDLPVRPSEDAVDDPPQRRLDLPGATGSHGHLVKFRTNTARQTQ